MLVKCDIKWITSPDGGMVDALDSKSSEETHESSSLSPGTNKKTLSGILDKLNQVFF